MNYIIVHFEFNLLLILQREQGADTTSLKIQKTFSILMLSAWLIDKR